MSRRKNFSQATPAINFLTSAGIGFETFSYASEGETGQYGKDAAAALGVDECSVFKTLVVLLDADELVACLVPAEVQAMLKSVAAAFGGKRAELAPPAVVQRRTGYVLGGVSPFGMKHNLPTIIDDSALGLPRMYVSGGRRGLELALAPHDVAEVLSGRFVSIARR